LTPLKRINGNDPEWEKYMDEVNEFKASHDKKFVSLNEEVRKKEQEEADEKKFEHDNEIRKKLGLKPLTKDEIPKESDDQKEDPILDETGHILADFISLQS
jgi:hypothetical protein